MTSGVYVIELPGTGEVYVGSSRNIELRWATHQRMLDEGVHHCRRLRLSYALFPEARLHVVEREVPAHALLEAETRVVYDYQRRLGPERVLNTRVPRRGVPATSEAEFLAAIDEVFA